MKAETQAAGQAATATKLEQVDLQLAELARQEGEAAKNHANALAEVDRLSREIGTRLIAGQDVSDLQTQLQQARSQAEATAAHVDAIPRHTKPLVEQQKNLQLQLARERVAELEARTVEQLTELAKALAKAYDAAEPLLGIKAELGTIKSNLLNQTSRPYSGFEVGRFVSPVEELLREIEQFCSASTEAAKTSTEKRTARRSVLNYPKSLPPVVR